MLSKSDFNPQKWHTLGIEETITALKGNVSVGLTTEEAITRKQLLGPNRLTEEKHESFWKEFLEELREPLILMLIGTGILYALWGELSDAITIFVVILTLNTIEVVNEQRAKKAISSLRKLAEPTTSILRNGHVQEIPAEEVVVGDVIQLQTGRRVPADARLIEAYGLAVDESSLTGESVPVEKNAHTTLKNEVPLAEHLNMTFAGTLVTRGRGNAIVIGTGMLTELGRVAGLTRQIKQPRTPLQKTMVELSRWMVWLALGFSVLVPALGYFVARQPLKTMLLTGLSLAFATIPEELPIIITMVMGLGAYRLSKKKAIVRRLKAVETLGAVTVIATDKTGTLTENRMEVSAHFPESNRERIFEIGVLCNDASLDSGEYSGDPVDTALLRAAARGGIDPSAVQSKYPLRNEFTFDNTRKRMSVIRNDSGGFLVAVKGAPEAILSLCIHQWTPDGEESFTSQARETILEQATQMAANGLRVIAFAEKKAATPELSQEQAESNLVFIGLAGLADPPRLEAHNAIQVCQEAGIRTMMVTGDHPITAKSIANQVGLKNDGGILTGPELDQLSDERLRDVVEKISIYARTTPEHKLRIVRALQQQGERVAVTGDGTNDAPALVAGDIGVAMGESGSDVAREAGDIVLADDNFTTITNAISEGRVLFENLKKAVRYYLTCKVALVSITLLPVLLKIPVPFAPVQIILMELFMDLAAAATFVIEPAEGDVMQRPPRNPRERFMDRAMVTSIFVSAAGLFSAVSLVYLTTWYSGASQVVAQTVAFAAWLLGHVLLAFNMRSARQPLYQVGFFSNRLMIAWGIAATLFILSAVYFKPLQTVLKTAALTGPQWILIVGATAAGTFWLEIYKVISFNRKAESEKA
jgi:Ca2+-transporting ATPase